MSIFSINDNSNYNSILSQAKANKESKENSKISFANAFLKQNASKLNEIQSANSQTLIRSEVLNSTNTTNTSNNTNFSISSKTSSPNYDISSEFKNSIYTLKYKQADINTNTAYGYSVDKDGYMGSDFNKAAGLPKDFKIHKSTLDEIQRYNENSYFFADKKEYLGISGNYFTNIDMADTIKQYYNQFNQIINHTFNDTNKTSFSEADLNSLPKGVSYSSNDKTIGVMPKNYDKLQITNYYNTQEQYDEMEQLGTIASISLGLQPLDFTPQSMQTQNLDQDSARDTFNPDMSVYPKNEDGTYTKEDLFMSFLKSTGVPLREGSATLNPRIESYQAAMAKESFDGSLASLDDIMTGKVDFASLLKGYAQDGWLDADIYAMEKGIKWQNHIGYGGGAWFERELNQAKANGWKASSESINSYVNNIMDRLNNLIGQTRV
ncbi:Cj0814 family flagellar-dependent secreted protein [Campylobacter sp. LH-2024]|uniref:Cj0814 family flagellar-dependent secreted protein n=1 Tax=Campylobacter sp. LH-2024 TaxID=3239825 RepID=UPI003AA924D3